MVGASAGWTRHPGPAAPTRASSKEPHAQVTPIKRTISSYKANPEQSLGRRYGQEDEFKNPMMKPAGTSFPERSARRSQVDPFYDAGTKAFGITDE